MTSPVCPDCGAPMTLSPTAPQAAPGRPAYRCPRPTCFAHHGAHPNGRPPGFPAQRVTRAARAAAHAALAAYCAARGVDRDWGYRLVARVMGLPDRQAHIGRFTAGECRSLIARLARLADVDGLGPAGFDEEDDRARHP